MPLKSADELRQLVVKMLCAAGADRRSAGTVAEHLVRSNLSGVDTHGMWQLQAYVADVQAGKIVPTAQPTIVQESATSALVSGNWTFGQVAACYAMEVAIQKAESHDTAVVGLVQTHHIGRLGHYVEMATSRKMVSLVWAGGFSEQAPVAAPYGGRTRVLSTNPVAMGFPTASEPTMMFDFATTAMSGVKVVNASRRDQTLPPGGIVDKHGRPSTNPHDFFDGGAHIPFGGHKGFALMMAAEHFGRILTGSDTHADADRGTDVMRHHGATMVVFKADLFRDFSAYTASADELSRRVRAVPPAPGFTQVMAPGDPEAQTRAERQRNCIPVDEDVWKAVVDTAISLGIQDGIDS